MKTPGGWIEPDRRASNYRVMCDALEHAEYDGADKGDGHIRGDNAQSADERTEERHWEISLVHVAAHTNTKVSEPFRAEKVSPAAVSRKCHTWNRWPHG
jgi:hypothetical protein